MNPSAAQRLLVVDDEPDLRTLYELTLLREGYDVESAGTLEEGWSLLQERGAGGFQLVITDMRLPDGSGLDLLRRLEETGRGEKAVVITAYGSAENAVEALKAALLAHPANPHAVAASFAEVAGPAPTAEHHEAIDRLFAFDTVEDIFAALEADGSDWALAQLATLKTKSPQSLKVTLRQLRLGASHESFADNMALEYRLGGRVVRTHDFQEGVRAVVVDKDNTPNWSPADLSGISEAELDRLFAPLPAGQEWTPLD